MFDQAKSGRYLIGQGYGWHSGVHLTSKMLPWGKGLRPIQAMLDGKIVAFRIHSDYQVATYQDQEFKYSNNFVLIEHEAVNPEDSEDVFKFHTLYMHIAPPSDIGANSSITTRYRLQEARNVRTFKHSDVPTNSGAKKQSMSKGTLLEYLYAEEKETHPYQIGKNTYKMIKCRVVENGESSSNREKALLNKIVWFASGLNSDFDILEDSSAVRSEPVSEPKWMSDNAAMIRDGSVVSLLPILFKEGIKVSAGEDIGYMGLHEYSNDAIGTKKDDNRVHIEMFSFEEPPEFFKKQISPKNAEENPLVVLDGADSSGAIDMSNSFIQQLLESVTEDQVTDFSSFTARDAKVYLDGKRKHFERFIVKHPTDWHTESSQSLYESIHQTAKEVLDIKCSAGFVTEEDYRNSPWRDQVMESFDLFSQFELERADKFSWMQDLQGDLQLGDDKSLWHYWPFILNVHFKDDMDLSWLIVPEGQITFNAEGVDLQSSHNFSRKVHWPGNEKSGVTIGRGYDCGNRSKSEVYNDMIAARVNERQAGLISDCAGLKGESAGDFVALNVDLIGEITRKSQYLLFVNIYPSYVERGLRNYEYWTKDLEKKAWLDLDQEIKDIAVDFVYQGFTKGPKPMMACMGNNKIALIDYIENSPVLMRYEAGRQRINYLRD